MSDQIQVDQIQIDFADFHAENPHVYVLWDKFTRELLAVGYKNGSASLVTERIRWETAVVTIGEPLVKLNNNYKSRYSRLWMKNNPEHAGFFRTRTLAANSRNAIDLSDDGDDFVAGL